MTDGTYCEACGDPIEQPPEQGRRRRTCTNACRKRLHRAEKHRAEHGRWPAWFTPPTPPAGRTIARRDKKP